MVKILSWDVGIINMAYCLLEVNDNKFKILEWELINLIPDHICNTCKKKANLSVNNEYYCTTHKIKGCIKLFNGKNYDTEQLCIKLIKTLDEKPSLLDCTSVIIENQPCLKNPKMKTVANCLYNYFLIRGVIDKKSIQNVLFISASNKLKIKGYESELKEENCSSKYQYYKKLAKEFSNKLIENNPNYIEIIKSNKKKDDLSDCLLQGYYYIKKNYGDIEII
jgi:hypothetical protein